MKRYCLLLFAASYFGLASAIPADFAEASTLSESVLIDAFEKGRSLVVVEVISVREDKASRSYFYKAKVVRPIILGDLTEDDIYEPVELFAGASFGDALKQGSTYALFVTKDCPYHFSWAHRNDVVRVDITDEKSLDDLARAAKGTYAETSIRKFRERKLTGRVFLPRLPEEILSACEQFRSTLTDRVEFAKKIHESDMGSRWDQSHPWSSISNYLLPATTLSRRHILYLLGPPTLKLARTYYWFCGKDKSASDPEKYVGIVSVTFDKDERGIRLLYGLQERAKWARYSDRSVGRVRLSEGARSVMLKFQKALADSAWESALSYCSVPVKAKAQEYQSPEAFFREVVPVEKLVQMSDFPIWKVGGKKLFGSFVQVTKPDAQMTITWEWDIKRADAGWVIDFATISLELWIEKETLRLRREAEKHRARVEKVRKSIRTRLTAVSEKFVVGKPMLFRLEMTNVSSDTLPYMQTPWMVNDPMAVEGPDGKVIPYIETGYQTWERSEVLAPGETVVLVDNYDVTSQYPIVEPGRYAFQFRGHGGWSGQVPSNTVEVDVRPGRLSAADAIVERLRTVLPQDWRLTRSVRKWKNAAGGPARPWIVVHLSGRHWRKGIDSGIGLLVYIYQTGSETLGHQSQFEGKPWGRSKWGLVYVHAFDTELLWPDYREQIIKALGIQ